MNHVILLFIKNLIDCRSKPLLTTIVSSLQDRLYLVVGTLCYRPLYSVTGSLTCFCISHLNVDNESIIYFTALVIKKSKKHSQNAALLLSLTVMIDSSFFGFIKDEDVVTKRFHHS